MRKRTTLSNALANFAALCDIVEHERDAVIISRPGRRDLALIDAEDLTRLERVADRLRSPEEVRELLEQAEAGEGASADQLALDVVASPA